MSAVAVSPFAPLTGSTPAFAALRRSAGQATDAVRRVKEAARKAAGGADRLGAAARSATTAVSTFGRDASSASTSMDKLRGPRAAGGVKSFGSRAAAARTAAGKIGTGVGGILAILLPMLPIADLVTGLMDTFGSVMTVASIAMTAVNVVMRANPLGFVLGIILPLAGYLIDLAMNSETGQRIMKQVFDQALKGFQAVWTFIQPFMKAVGQAVGTYVKAYLTVFQTALKIVGSAVGGIARIGSAVSSSVRALRGIASNTLGAVKNAVRPITDWVTDKVPGFFRTAKDAVTRSLRGIGDLVKGGLSTVLGVVKGPINGLIAFANWIIDGLNKLSFNFFGKKFGVDLDKIPMLAEGGVVFPGAPDAPRIDPLSDLERRRVPALTEPPRPPHRVRDFHEDPGAGPRSTAEDLLFLATAHACS
ncbi:tape-measure protein [Streptomyces sp. NPDC006197]|uniref:tape-measure protein n=1 Tax=Streptomyces sp. NPDC006197 TaxID=3156685 RepID=UPI0033BF2E1F